MNYPHKSWSIKLPPELKNQIFYTLNYANRTNYPLTQSRVVLVLRDSSISIFFPKSVGPTYHTFPLSLLGSIVDRDGGERRGGEGREKREIGWGLRRYGIKGREEEYDMWVPPIFQKKNCWLDCHVGLKPHRIELGDNLFDLHSWGCKMSAFQVHGVIWSMAIV